MTEPTDILVVGTHPDDEILGCGGTVALHTEAGDRVTSVIVCEGESIRYEGQDVDLERDSREAAKVLGVDEVRHFGLPDQKLDTLPLTDVITPLEDVIEEREPELIYTQWGGDVNQDHEVVFDAVLVAARPLEEHIEALLAFDTPSSTEWGYPQDYEPDTWVDISSTLETKIEAMRCYETELKEYPHPRSEEALRHRAHAWGNRYLMDSAEVYTTVRRVTRDGPPV